MKKSLINEEISRIQEIMGMNKQLITEGEKPLVKLFDKMGIGFENMMRRMEEMYGNRYLDKIKGLFEKIVLDDIDREFICALILKSYPTVAKAFAHNIENVVFRNSSAELDGVFRLFRNKNITSSEIADHVLDRRLGIKMSPESVQMWRTVREMEIPIGGNRTPQIQTTKPTTQVNTTSVNTTPVTKSIENSLSGGKILEPHEFTVEGTNAGYKVYKGDKANALGDIRQETGASIKDNYTKESVINGKKVFTLVNTTQKDYVGRSGYASVSISLPLNTKLTINDVLSELQNRMKMEQSPGGSMYNEFMRNR